MMKKVLIWGIGKNYRANRSIIRSDIEIVGFVDNNPACQGTIVDGKPVYSPENACGVAFDFIFIFCQKYPEVRKQIMSMNFSDNVVVYDITQIEVLCDLPPAVYYGENRGENNKNRLLIFSPALSSTGAQNIMLSFVGLIREKYNVTVVSKSDGPVRGRLEDFGASIVICADFRLENEAISKELASADLVLVNTIWLGYLVDFLRDTGKKVIWWLHESAMLSYIDRPCIQRALMADNIYPYAVSNIVVDYLEGECGLPGTIKLFPFGLPEYPSYYQKDHEKIVFAIISGINYIKGQDIFVHAVEKLPKEIRKKAEFWIIGAGGLDQETQAISDSIPEIVVKGEIDNREMPRVYSELDVVVCCSREESMSVTVIEGFMNEKNTIISEHAGVAAYITDGINGFVVKNEDVDGFSQRMQWIIENRADSKAMGKKSREIYNTYFTQEAFRENIDRVFKEVLED